MRILIIFILELLLTCTVWAQPRTTGGPIPVTKLPYSSYKVEEFQYKTIAAFKQFTSILLKREVACGVKSSLQRSDTLMTSYYRLNLTNSKNECITDQKLLACIQNDEYLKYLYSIKNDPDSVKYIAAKFKLGQTEAQEVYKFFVTLDNEKTD